MSDHVVLWKFGADSGWSFGSDRDDATHQAAARIAEKHGFDPGQTFEFTTETEDGTIRDHVAFTDAEFQIELFGLAGLEVVWFVRAA